MDYEGLIAERRALIPIVHELRAMAAAARDHVAVREYTQQAVLARYDIAKYTWLRSRETAGYSP
jgi:hypothetical protein